MLSPFSNNLLTACWYNSDEVNKYYWRNFMVKVHLTLIVQSILAKQDILLSFAQYFERMKWISIKFSVTLKNNRDVTGLCNAQTIWCHYYGFWPPSIFTFCNHSKILFLSVKWITPNLIICHSYGYIAIGIELLKTLSPILHTICGMRPGPWWRTSTMTDRYI